MFRLCTREHMEANNISTKKPCQILKILYDMIHIIAVHRLEDESKLLIMRKQMHQNSIFLAALLQQSLIMSHSTCTLCHDYICVLKLIHE